MFSTCCLPCHDCVGQRLQSVLGYPLPADRLCQQIALLLPLNPHFCCLPCSLYAGDLLLPLSVPAMGTALVLPIKLSSCCLPCSPCAPAPGPQPGVRLSEQHPAAAEAHGEPASGRLQMLASSGQAKQVPALLLASHAGVSGQRLSRGAFYSGVTFRVGAGALCFNGLSNHGLSKAKQTASELQPP